MVDRNQYLHSSMKRETIRSDILDARTVSLLCRHQVHDRYNRRYLLVTAVVETVAAAVERFEPGVCYAVQMHDSRQKRVVPLLCVAVFEFVLVDGVSL